MDRIDLHLDLSCIVGILARERVEPQPLSIDVAMWLDLGPCGTTGELERSVDYGAVDAQIRFLATAGGFRLIESLAVAILRVLLAPPDDGRAQIERARVRIAKPEVLRAAVPAVTMERDAAWALPASDTVVDLEEVTVRLVRAGETLEGGGQAMILGASQPASLPLTAPATVLHVAPRAWSPS